MPQDKDCGQFEVVVFGFGSGFCLFEKPLHAGFYGSGVHVYLHIGQRV